MAAGDQQRRVYVMVAAVWTVVIVTVAGWAETADQRLVSLGLITLTATGSALAASKKGTFSMHHIRARSTDCTNTARR